MIRRGQEPVNDVLGVQPRDDDVVLLTKESEEVWLLHDTVNDWEDDVDVLAFAL